MFDAHAFNPSPVDQPLIGLDALRHLLHVVFSSALYRSGRDQEGWIELNRYRGRA